MKRSQEFSQPTSPAQKKLKSSPSTLHDSTIPEPPSPNTESKQDEWTKVEKRKTKKTKKMEQRLDGNPPRFMYAKGEILKRKEAVGITDIRDLALHIVADAPPPSWVRVENPRSIHKVVTLLIPGLTPDLLGLPPLPTSATSNPHLPLAVPLPTEPLSEDTLRIPFISSTFSHACPTRAPGDQNRMHSVLSAFFQCPVSGEEKKKRILERVTSERSQDKNATQYLLTLEQMIENDYPLPSYVAQVFEKPPGWLETPEPAQDPSSGTPEIIAIDCEMCQTEDGKELARVCMINHSTGKVIYDELVKPRKPIIDYLTRWSGITEEALTPVTTTLEQVQAHVLSVLSAQPTPILLGHSLESDLKALKLCHPLCIDTALIYHHPRGRPLKPGLAWLTKKWCGREIQNRGEGGHDPEEDARACLDLLKKKIDNGPGFGEFKTDQESIFERMGRARQGTIRAAVVDHGNPANFHGTKASTTTACKSDAEVLDGLLAAIPAHTFTFGRFTGVADALGWITSKSTGDVTQPASSSSSLSPPDLVPVLATLNEYLVRLYAALPPRTAVMIFTGHSDPRRMSELNTRKAAFENALRMGRSLEDVGKDGWWTSAHGRELEEEVEKAKRGLLFLSIKNAK